MRSRHKKIFTVAELIEMDINELDTLAFGYRSGDLVELDPKKINIQYPGDLENPAHKFSAEGMEWIKSISFDEPVSVEIDDQGKFQLADGHHRWFGAKKLGNKLLCKIEVKGNPVKFILNRQREMDARSSPEP